MLLPCQGPQQVLVPTSSIWQLSKQVPHCFQQDAVMRGLCKVLQRCQKENRSLFSQTDLRLQMHLHLFVFIPGLLLQLWLSAKIISNQFSICFQCWYRQLIRSLQRPDVPHIVSYSS